MNNYISAFGSGALTVITALTVLWTTEGVASFADVSEVGYAVAILGGIGAAIKDMQSRRAEPT